MAIAGGETTIDPGSFLWVSSDIEHDMSQSDVRQPVVMYHLRVVLRSASGAAVRLSEDSFVLPHALALHRLYEGWFSDPAMTSPYAASIAQGLILQTFGQLFVGLERSLGGRRLTAEQQQRLRRFCDAHIANSPTPASLAAYLDLSVAYMARLFRATFGTSPKSWLADERMRMASVRLVETNLPIGAIAQDLGYADVYSFSRQFSRSIGCSPTAFRDRHRLLPSTSSSTSSRPL
jgi:AraC-like DNA-binding protein